MDIKIIKIAADTTYMNKIDKYTHSAKMKNSLCGDNIFFKINIKKKYFRDIYYESNACVYCQASANLLAKHIINNNLDKFRKILDFANSYYNDKKFLVGSPFDKIFNEKNFIRKDCIYLPVKTIAKALKLK